MDNNGKFHRDFIKKEKLFSIPLRLDINLNKRTLVASNKSVRVDRPAKLSIQETYSGKEEK